jgi:hypothetical protein
MVDDEDDVEFSAQHMAAVSGNTQQKSRSPTIMPVSSFDDGRARGRRHQMSPDFPAENQQQQQSNQRQKQKATAERRPYFIRRTTSLEAIAPGDTADVEKLAGSAHQMQKEYVFADSIPWDEDQEHEFKSLENTQFLDEMIKTYCKVGVKKSEGQKRK